MMIKWNKSAVKQLFEIVNYLESRNEIDYAEILEKQILDSISSLSAQTNIYQLDRIKQNNDGNFFAFEIESYQISYRKIYDEIRILRIRHSSRKPFIK
ncbi:MAG: type II toxin-antitoxin system RelE/ParE family toxin [Janthinobacterium lividum]